MAEPRRGPEIEPERRRSPWSWRLWLALACALGLAAATGVLPELLAVRRPWTLLAALPLGHLALACSTALMRLSLRQGAQAFWASLCSLYRPYGGSTLLFCALLALAEEVLLRGLPLMLLGCGWLQVLGLSVLFALLHAGRRGRRGLGLLVMLDTLLFGLALCLLFCALGELWPLVVIHFVRNGSVAKVFVRRDRLLREANAAP